MLSINIEHTKSTPSIKYDPDERVLFINGESYPENATKFFSPFFDWLLKLLNQDDNKYLRVDMELLYFNSSSSKALMNMFDYLEVAAEKGWRIVVNWIYQEENETSLECGEEFQEDCRAVEFNLVAVPDSSL